MQFILAKPVESKGDVVAFKFRYHGTQGTGESAIVNQEGELLVVYRCVHPSFVFVF